MNTEEHLDEQTPADTKPTRYPECRCNALAHGGCRCDDDGEARMGAAERDEWSEPGAPLWRVAFPDHVTVITKSGPRVAAL